MGIKTESLKLILDHISDCGRSKNSMSIRMAELGNQHLKFSDSTLAPYLHTLGFDPEKLITGKDLFVGMGMDHVSIDLNGKDGSLEYDLCAPLPENMHLLWDMVTNLGTSEHVPCQYNCFKNIHNLAAAGSVMIHVVSANPSHGGWNYDEGFFYALAEANDYKVLLAPDVYSKIKEAHISCVLGKKDCDPFCTRGNFMQPLRVGDFEAYRILNMRKTTPCPR